MLELQSPEALRSYVEVIRRLSGAATVSIFVPTSWNDSWSAMLVHAGDPSRIPELADLDAANSFAGRTSVSDSQSNSLPLLPSELANAVLIPLPTADVVWALSPSSERRRDSSRARPGRRKTDSAVARRARSPSAWLGIRFLAEQGLTIADRFASDSLALELTGEDSPARWWNWLFNLGGAVAAQTAQVSALLTDPVSGLLGRAALEVALSDELARTRLKGGSLCLLFVNPDGFAAVNERVGREAGDGIVREIVIRLRSALRKSDLVARYGGVVYAILLSETPLELGKSVADKILRALTETAFSNGVINLDFSIGLAGFESGDDGIKLAPDLLRRADQALNTAKRSGGDRVEVWEPGPQAEGVGQDRLAGIFTGNMSRDYRNMALLWDAVNVMAATDDFEPLAARVAEGLYSAFLPVQVGVFGRSEKDEPSLIKGLARQPGDTATTTPREMPDLGQEKRVFLQRAFLERRMLQASSPSDTTEERSQGDTFFYFVPLVARQQHLGGLYFEDSHPLDSSDLLFLQALAAQLALALDRARLAAEDRRRLEQEGQRLRIELDQLEQALQRAKLEYRSGEMEAVVATARRVAPTDATVLIMGESGTGKELLARTIHELSPRRSRLLIVVDCGSIAASLADSELFGHERGAYTGAQERKVGRLAEGDGGTVLLDEIGELPLEIQSKLLRFVQEKQITAVGGTHPRKVDVRIIAATNRDLASDVSAGRFREDLYHRLNVVRLVVPPLRARPDDILYLANLFLEKYSVLHHKSVRRLAPESEALLLRHDWPGNVRELQNRLMQAVILCEKDELGPAELGLLKPSTEDSAADSEPLGLDPQSRVERLGGGSGYSRTTAESAGPAAGVEQLLECLRAALAQQIESALNGKVPFAMPLGRWLTADLILEADAAAAGVIRRGAAFVGIPETTFRRLLHNASQQAKAGLSPRPSSWNALRTALQELVRAPDLSGENLVQQTRQVLLQEVLARVAENEQAGAALLGVSLPTFRRHVSKLATRVRASGDSFPPREASGEAPHL